MSLVDGFGNAIDPAVGYARGKILTSSVEESIKTAHARQLIRERAIGRHEGVAIFTGNPRGSQLMPEDVMSGQTEEWVGPALFGRDLEACVRDHLGASELAGVTVFNRTSAGLIASCVALASSGVVVALAPFRGGSHVSVVRGARLAGAEFVEVTSSEELVNALRRFGVSLVVVTSVTSELESLSAEEIAKAGSIARASGVPTLIDDAYGARLRPVLESGPRSLEMPVDLAISNSDKAGLPGPRAGFMAGRPEYVAAVSARASELGLEARAPIALGVLRGLQTFDPAVLRREQDLGQRLFERLAGRLPRGAVKSTPLGPMVREEQVLEIAADRAGIEKHAISIVPCEATAALGMLLLDRFGILTVNAAGAPGARTSLRLKPVPGAVEEVGGIEAVVAAVDTCLDELAGALADGSALRRLILGDN